MTTVSQDKTPKQLPNCVREAFLGIDAYKTAMVLDLLFTLGFEEGQWITYQEALEVGSQHTAIHIIRDGLKHDTIKREAIPQERRGRPTFRYQLPSIYTLKKNLCVEWSGITDILTLEDFANGKSYRQALHRELIRRGYEENGNRPKAFSRKWLCERLSVCAKTLRRYEAELRTWVQSHWEMIPIKSLVFLHEVPKQRAHNGQFLSIVSRDGTKRRLPAIRKVAGMYFNRGYEVNLMRRRVNEYAPYSPYSKEAHRDRHGEWADFIDY